MNLETLKNYVEQEKRRMIPINDLKGIILDAYKFYTNSIDHVIFKKGAILDPITQLGDPLSNVTRKERKLLLSLSLLTLLIVKVGLFPTKISAFGIDFSANNISAFFSILGFAILYFFIVFIIYCISDIRIWRMKAFQSTKDVLQYSPLELKDSTRLQDILEAVEGLDNLEKKVVWYYEKSKYYSKFSNIRIFIEFIFPLIFSAYVLFLSFTFDSNKIVGNNINNSEQLNKVDTTNVLKDSLNIDVNKIK